MNWCRAPLYLENHCDIFTFSFTFWTLKLWLFACLGIIPIDFTPGLRLAIQHSRLIMNNAFYSECLQWYNCHPCLLTHDSNTFPYQEIRTTSTASSLTLILLLESFQSRPQVRRNNHNPRRHRCCWCCRVINISLSSHIVRVHLGKFHFKFYEGCRKRLMKFVKLEFLPAAKWKFLWCHATQRRCISFSNHQSTLLPHCQQPPA